MPTGRRTVHARDLLASIPDAQAGLVITDPPWAIHGGGIFDACASYQRSSVQECADILSDARRALVKGGHLYVFATAGREIRDVADAFERHGWRFLRLLAWDRATYSGMGAWRNAWEPVFIFSNGKSRGFAKHQAYSSLLRARSIGRRTAKPHELYEVFIEMSSRPGELVVDPFCGAEASRMALREPKPAQPTVEDVRGTIWEGLAQLRGGASKHPFQLDSPGQNENPQLYAGEVRTITYKGSGELLLFNIDLPLGVTLAVSLDGVVRKYSHGNEAGVLRWNAGESPFRFQSSLELVLTNTTGAGQRYKVYLSGA